jgi:uncharacterized protein (TIGR03086 family)
MTQPVKFGQLTEAMTQNTDTDPRGLYARTLQQTADVIAAVRPGQLGLPTPCPEWDVRKLMSHITGVVIRTAILGEGGDALSVPPFADGLPDDGWPAAFEAATRRTLAAWSDDAKLEKPVTVPWGTVPGAVAVGGYVREILAHGWDLGTATGQPTELDPELAEYALAVSVKTLTPQMRADERVPFGPVVEIDPAAGIYARLAAWLGRPA